MQDSSKLAPPNTLPKELQTQRDPPVAPLFPAAPLRFALHFACLTDGRMILLLKGESLDPSLKR